MNTKIICGIVFGLASIAPAFADDATIEDIAARTGLSERQVKMVLGPSTPYAEYRTSYDFARERVDQAILEDQLHPAVTVGEVETAPTTTTTTTTYPAVDDDYSTDQLQMQSDDSNSNDDDEDDYDGDND